MVRFWVELLELDKSQDLSDDTRKIIEKLENDKHPLQFRGVPTFAQNPIFANTEGDIKDDIERLWQLLKSATQWADGKGNRNDFIEKFDRAIEVHGVALPKVTAPLFWSRPNSFLSLDDNSQDYITMQLQASDDYFDEFNKETINKEKGNGTGKGKRYLDIIEDVKKYFSSANAREGTFAQLSYNAYAQYNDDDEYQVTDWKEKSVHKYEQTLDPNLTKEAREALVKSRANQGKFRICVLDEWHHQCSVGDKGGYPLCTNDKFLDACHIKPYSELEDGDEETRYNGLILTPNLHKAFDRGIIAFASDGTIQISKAYKKEAKQLGIDKAMRLCQPKNGTLHEETKKHLEHHRKNVFEK